MTSPNFSLPYPPILNDNDSLVTFKVLVPTGYLTVVNVYTTGQSTVGKFFCTNIVFHDPSPLAGTNGSVVLSIGSASTSTTSICPQIQLSGLSGSVANQYVCVNPATFAGGLGFNNGATTTFSSANLVATSAQALAPGDVMQVFIGTTAGTTNGNIFMDVVGYYL